MNKESILDTEEFIKWFKENQPLCGKAKTMKKICDAFPESAFYVKQPFPPYGYSKYSTLAAIVMNTLKDEGKMKTYKKGRTYCYEIIGDNVE